MMVTDHRFCQAYFERSEMMEDVAKEGVPYWNGEDIFMALVARKLTGVLPKRYDLPVRKLPQGAEAINRNRGHMEYRTKMMQLAAERLGLPCDAH